MEQPQQMQQEHDDVDLLLECTQLEAIELMADDPKYYLGLVENYRTRRDGSSVYLPYELNTNVNRRADGCLIIQFKLDRNGRWYEVGYDGGESFTDEDVYRAFSEKAKLLLKFPPPERSHLCEQALGDPTDVSEYNNGNGSGDDKISFSEAEPLFRKEPQSRPLPDFMKPINTRDMSLEEILKTRNIGPPPVSFEELLKNRDADLNTLPPIAAQPVQSVLPVQPAGNSNLQTEEYVRAIINLIRVTPESLREKTDAAIVKLLTGEMI